MRWYAVCVENFDDKFPPSMHHVIWSSSVLREQEAMDAAASFDCPPGFRVGIRPHWGTTTQERLEQFQRQHGWALWMEGRQG